MKPTPPLAVVALAALATSTTSLLANSPANEWTDLLDKDLSRWEIWQGIPLNSVEGLPAGTPLSDQFDKGTPLGLSNHKNVFSTKTVDGDLALYITGEIFGGITTKETYSNYHLQVQFKWGEKKWEPRLDRKRDSGILYHCYGDHGSFWGVWKSSLEFQVQEHDMGDFIALAGPYAQYRGRNDGGRAKWGQSNTLVIWTERKELRTGSDRNVLSR